MGETKNERVEMSSSYNIPKVLNSVLTAGILILALAVLNEYAMVPKVGIHVCFFKRRVDDQGRSMKALSYLK
jgi:hypothetical protein